MEADRVARRRQSDVAVASKRRSLVPRRARGLAVTEVRSVCGLCRRQQVEPRVLPCLHSFCTGCLMELELSQAGHDSDQWSNEGSGDAGGAGGGKAEGGDGSSGSSGGGSTPRQLSCPLCNVTHPLPAGGVQGLPPDFVLQHRLLLASLVQEAARALCDLCSSDVPANSRCTDCMLSLCPFCAEAHGRQRVTVGHGVLPLAEARRVGLAKARRLTVSCSAHPSFELQLFCAPCATPVCRDCVQRGLHRGHSVDTTARAAQLCTRGLRDAVERARPVAEQAVGALDRLAQLHKRIETRCAQVTLEVDKFVDAYVAALEEHRRALQRQVQEARAAKLQLLQAQEAELERRAEEAATAVRFTEDLLAEASEVELLSLVATVLRRLEWCYSGLGSSGGLLEPRVSDCLQFLAEESPAPVKSFTLFGVITTQTVSPHHCTLNTDSRKKRTFFANRTITCILTLRGYEQGYVIELASFLNGKHSKAEALMTTRDSDEQPLCHGGEKVTVDLRYKDASHRKIPIQVNDRRDGSYLLTFVPDTPGNLNLSITVRGKPIKGSPFLICVRTLRPHHGTYYCCSFCSSNGSKEATCGCGGKMPGGYKGCGHGHTGHPGRRHWSCCGNILENSECGKANSNVYQFSL